MVGIAIQNGDLTDKHGGRRGRHWDAMMVLNHIEPLPFGTKPRGWLENLL